MIFPLLDPFLLFSEFLSDACGLHFERKSLFFTYYTDDFIIYSYLLYIAWYNSIFIDQFSIYKLIAPLILVASQTCFLPRSTVMGENVIVAIGRKFTFWQASENELTCQNVDVKILKNAEGLADSQWYF